MSRLNVEALTIPVPGPQGPAEHPADPASICRSTMLSRTARVRIWWGRGAASQMGRTGSAPHRQIGERRFHVE